MVNTKHSLYREDNFVKLEVLEIDIKIVVLTQSSGYNPVPL